MADNLTTQSTNPATVPASTQIATDDVSGVHFQKVKLVDGTADSTTGIPGDASNGLDVDVTRVQGTVTVGDGGNSLTVDDGGSSLTVDGTVTVQDGGGTISVDDGAGSLTVDGTVAVSSVSGTVAVSGPLTDTQLRAAAVPVSDGGGSLTVDGTVGVSGTVTVDGSGVTQPVSGPLTDTQLRATAVPVSGTFYPATQPVSGTVGVSGTVTVDGSGVTQPVSASSLPLPSGAATSANQGTANTSLASIDGKTPALGQALSAGSVPVVLPAAQVTTLTPPTSVGITGTVTVAAHNVTLVPATSGGLTISKRISVGTSASNDAYNLKTTAGQVYGWYITNKNASPYYIKLHNSNANPPVAGTTAVAMTIMVPGNTSGAGVVAAEFSNGLAFGSGIGVSMVSGVADNNAGAITADDVVVHIFYK